MESNKKWPPEGSRKAVSIFIDCVGGEKIHYVPSEGPYYFRTGAEMLSIYFKENRVTRFYGNFTMKIEEILGEDE